jgi:hypothetical protein
VAQEILNGNFNRSTLNDLSIRIFDSDVLAIPYKNNKNTVKNNAVRIHEF